MRRVPGSQGTLPGSGHLGVGFAQVQRAGVQELFPRCEPGECELAQREGFRLPVEVVRFAWRDTRRRLSAFLPESELRGNEGGSEPFVTDEGHYILDAPIPPDADPATLAVALKTVPGVVEHGLFLDMAELALLGKEDGSVERLERPAPPA